MDKLKNEKINNMLIILAFIFNIVVFAPIEIYYTNKNEVWFKLKDFLPIILLISLLLIIISTILLIFLKGKRKSIFLKILFALTVCLYVQGNFLNLGYSALDGNKVNWNSMISKGIVNTLLWILIILLPYGIKKLKKEENFKVLTSIISIFIILIETITLITVSISNIEKKNTIKGLSNENIFTLSQKNNIVVFMSDTFEGTYMNQILEEHPEYKEKLQDFTYFDNCTGVSFFTYSSMPTLLTGVECQVGNTLKENLEYCFNNTNLYQILKQNNYYTEIYVENALKPQNEIVDNLLKKEDKTTFESKLKLSEKLYKYTLYRYMPHFLKSNFEVTNDDFNSIKKSNSASTYKEKTYFLDDVEFNKNLLEFGIKTQNNKNSFKFYETNGMHIPYTTMPNLTDNYSDEYYSKSDKEKKYNEGLASLNLLCNYIEELKKADIYENTTIIFLADHGFSNRFYTNLLVKKANDSHKFNISSAPVSTLEDLVPTILNLATNSKDYGKDFFDYKENEKRTRIVQDFNYTTNITKGNDYKVISKVTYKTDENVKNKDSFYIADEEYKEENKQLTEKYQFNTKTEIKDIESSTKINLIGFALEQLNIKIPRGCSLSKTAYLIVNKEQTDRNVTADFKIKKVYDYSQKINFKINGETIYSCIATNKNNMISFEIPRELWNSNDNLIIEMEFPDAKLGTVFPTVSSAIQLDYFNFKI